MSVQVLPGASTEVESFIQLWVLEEYEMSSLH